MAVYYDPTILRVYRKYIQTDKGPLWMTWYDVDCPIVQGDSIRFSARTMNIHGSSVFVHYDSIPSVGFSNVLTQVTSVDERLTIACSNGEDKYEYTIKLDDRIIASGSGSWSSAVRNKYTGIGIGIHGTNGGNTIADFVYTLFSNTQQPFTVYANGINSLGNFYIEDYNVNQKVVQAGSTLMADADYFYGASREYGDPYEDGDYTDPGGESGPGEGEWELPNEDIAMGGSPYNDMSAGLYRAYAMTAEQLTDFSDQLWNTDVLDALSRYVQNPADLVLSLMSFPFDVDSSSTATQIGFNWLNAWNLSSIVTYGYRIPDGHNQHIEFGKIKIPKYSGTFYDYGPYSSIELHLPYIGFVPLKMNECVGRNIYIDYYVDVITGDFTAEVTSDGYETLPNKFAYGTPILGVYQGNIGRPLPLTQQNLWQVYKKIGETAVAAIVAGAGAGLGAAAGAEADKFVALEAKYKEAGVSDAAQLARESADEYRQLSDSGYTVAKRSGLAGAANAILNMQSVNAPIVRNGSVDGSNGRTSSQECFVILSVPDQNVPDNQKILGYPSNIPGPLSKVSGYAEVREIRLHSTIANNSELAEIEEIVRGGIII